MGFLYVKSCIYSMRSIYSYMKDQSLRMGKMTLYMTFKFLHFKYQYLSLRSQHPWFPNSPTFVLTVIPRSIDSPREASDPTLPGESSCRLRSSLHVLVPVFLVSCCKFFPCCLPSPNSDGWHGLICCKYKAYTSPAGHLTCMVSLFLWHIRINPGLLPMSMAVSHHLLHL